MKQFSKLAFIILCFLGLSILFTPVADVFADSTQVHISVDPNPSKSSGSLHAYDIVLQFDGGSPSEKIDYVKTEIGFNNQQTVISSMELSSENKLGRILFEDNVQEANNKGKITLELGALAAGAGPSTDKKLVIGEIKTNSSNPNSPFTISGTQVVNNSSYSIPVTDTVSVAPSPSSEGGFFHSILLFFRSLLGLK